MSFSGTKVRWAAVGAALLSAHAHGAAGNGRHAVLGNDARPMFVSSVEAATDTSQAKHDTRSAKVPSPQASTNPKDNAGGPGEPQTSEPKPPSPECSATPFIFHIKSAEEFVDQAEKTPSLPQGLGIFLTDASKRMEELKKKWESPTGGTPCDDGGTLFVKPAENADVASLLASAQAYLAAAAIDAKSPGATAQTGADLNAVIEDIKKVQDNLPAKGETGEAAETGKPSEIVLAGAAVVFLFALAVALWSYWRLSMLAKQMASRSGGDARTEFEDDRLPSELASLKHKLEDLEKKLAQQEADLKQLASDRAEGVPNVESADEEFDARDAREGNQAVDPGHRAPTQPGDSVSSEKAPASAPVLAKEPVRDPVADYNHTRAMRPGERAERFRGLYPSQRKLEWVNPSARMSSDPSKLRLREDPLGNLLAIVEGRNALIFPDLTYGYESGRNSLEGVFVYPPEGTASSRVVEAAAAEREGDEWRLQSRGQFGG